MKIFCKFFFIVGALIVLSGCIDRTANSVSNSFNKMGEDLQWILFDEQ